MSYFSLGRNHLRRAAAAPTMTPAAATLYPPSYLYDSSSALQAVFGSVAADSRVDVDRNLLYGGDGEPADATTGWTVETGTLTRDTVTKNAGAASLKLVHTAAGAAYSDIPVCPGERVQIPAIALYGGGGTITARVSLQNLTTGKYLKSDATWDPAVQYLGSRALASWASSAAFTATIESLVACGGDPAPLLRWRIEISEAGTVYFDDMGIWPLLDFVGVFGHAVPARLVTKLLLSDTGAFGGEETLAATLTPAQPIMWARLQALSTKRYARLKLEGTPVVAPAIGEFVLAQTQSLSQGPVAGPVVDAQWPQVRSRSDAGTQRVYNKAKWPPRKVTLSFYVSSEAALRQVRDEFWVGSSGGMEPVVFIGPSRMGSDFAVWGRIEGDLHQSFPEALADGIAARVEVVIQEEGFALA